MPLFHLRKLEGRYSDFTNFETIFYAIQFADDAWLGVVGDEGNASYEWFVSTPDSFEFSNCGYGDSLLTLREVLMSRLSQ